MKEEITFYSYNFIFALYKQVQLYMVVNGKDITYRLEDYSIEIKEDVRERIVSENSSLSEFYAYIFNKYTKEINNE